MSFNSGLECWFGSFATGCLILLAPSFEAAPALDLFSNSFTPGLALKPSLSPFVSTVCLRMLLGGTTTLARGGSHSSILVRLPVPLLSSPASVGTFDSWLALSAGLFLYCVLDPKSLFCILALSDGECSGSC